MASSLLKGGTVDIYFHNDILKQPSSQEKGTLNTSGLDRILLLSPFSHKPDIIHTSQSATVFIISFIP